MGPGPSNVHSRVYRALSTPLVGHLDPEFLQIMDEIQNLLRFVFQTKNRFTIAVSGSGSSGMEAALVNIIEPGDTVIVGVNGVFGNRMSDIVERCGGKLVQIKAPWGQSIDIQRIEDELKQGDKIKAVALVHAETSTGVLQPLEEVGTLSKQYGALLVVDSVTSLGGVPVQVDAWNIDVCYSGTQKCLSCPPGLAPLTLSDDALNVVTNRQSKIQSWYLDLTMIANYWEEGNRAYHHTAPISMNYALREALRLVQEEGLKARFERHQQNSQALIAGLQELELAPFVDEAIRLPTLNAIKVPPNVDEAKIRRTLLNDYNLEIGGGLGNLAGKVWRIGLMGESSTKANVVYLLAALKELLNA
ncbi:aminotransferase class V-fold PLP-dependent enzyme [candidate division KSB1 bacterium]|nr:aminotransferase class V-fold PLP-dependent enzyme [candidate division KSB1 bacterium]